MCTHVRYVAYSLTCVLYITSSDLGQEVHELQESKIKVSAVETFAADI